MSQKRHLPVMSSLFLHCKRDAVRPRVCRSRRITDCLTRAVRITFVRLYKKLDCIIRKNRYENFLPSQ